ncbi:MAG: hypothetical protein K6A44_02550 [bacterium]|nr:hypothetical protein [bacterium]
MRIPISSFSRLVGKSFHTSPKAIAGIGTIADKSAFALGRKGFEKPLGDVGKSHLAELLSKLKESMIETFHLGKSVMPEVVALENKMSAMGVRVTFEDNLETAKVITAAIEKVKAKGLKVPERIILFTPNAQNKGLRGWTTAYADIALFNKDLKVSKENLLPDFIKNMGIKPNATDTAEGVVFHEIGHYLHAKSPNAHEVWKTMTAGEFDFSLAREVGCYAINGDEFNAGREFVAEVFAGLMSGKQYSKRVMKIYNALNGPQIPGINMAGVDVAAGSLFDGHDIFKSIAKLPSKKSDIFGVLAQKSISKAYMPDFVSSFKK